MNVRPLCLSDIIRLETSAVNVRRLCMSFADVSHGQRSVVEDNHERCSGVDMVDVMLVSLEHGPQFGPIVDYRSGRGCLCTSCPNSYSKYKKCNKKKTQRFHSKSLPCMTCMMIYMKINLP